MSGHDRDEILLNACMLICSKVGIVRPRDPGAIDEILGLAEQVRLTREDVLRDPVFAASQITAYLDDLARNP